MESCFQGKVFWAVALLVVSACGPSRNPSHEVDAGAPPMDLTDEPGNASEGEGGGEREGEGESARIRGDKERELKTIESGAYKDAEKIRGLADAESTDIYAEAYNRDPKFYRLIKSLESYRNSIDENSVVMLSSDSEYFEPLVSSKFR